MRLCLLINWKNKEKCTLWKMDLFNASYCTIKYNITQRLLREKLIQKLSS